MDDKNIATRKITLAMQSPTPDTRCLPTYYDILHSMSPEELAKWFAAVLFNGSFYDELLEWLRSEVGKEKP